MTGCFAAAAGHEALVKWLVGTCGAYPWEKDDKDATPSDWIDLELPLSENSRAETLRRVKAYLASQVVVDMVRERIMSLKERKE